MENFGHQDAKKEGLYRIKHRNKKDIPFNQKVII